MKYYVLYFDSEERLHSCLLKAENKIDAEAEAKLMLAKLKPVRSANLLEVSSEAVLVTEPTFKWSEQKVLRSNERRF